MKLPRRWIFVCIGLLVGNAAVMSVLIVASTRSAPTVVPHYYERAVDWDRTVEEARAAERLGWKLELSLRQGGVTVEVRDASGQPLEGAAVSVRGFPRAFPKRQVALELVTGADGRATSAGEPLVPGWYELDLELQRGPVRIALHRAAMLPEAVAAKEPR